MIHKVNEMTCLMKFLKKKIVRDWSLFAFWSLQTACISLLHLKKFDHRWRFSIFIAIPTISQVIGTSDFHVNVMFMIKMLKILPRMFISTFKSDYLSRSELWFFWSINDFCELLTYDMEEIDSFRFSLAYLSLWVLSIW